MTKTEKIRIHLEEVGHITSLEAIKEYGATRLSAIIFNLRHKYNMDIENEWIEFNDRFGCKSRYVKYTYNKDKKRGGK